MGGRDLSLSSLESQVELTDIGLKIHRPGVCTFSHSKAATNNNKQQQAPPTSNNKRQQQQWTWLKTLSVKSIQKNSMHEVKNCTMWHKIRSNKGAKKTNRGAEGPYYPQGHFGLFNVQ